MIDLKDVIRSGKAPNDDLNCSIGQAQKLAGYFGILFLQTQAQVHGVFINTTESGPNTAVMIDIKDLDPTPSEGMEFYLHIQVSGPLIPEPTFWACSQMISLLESQGLELMTREYLSRILDQFPTMNYLVVPTVYQGIVDTLSDIYVSA